MTRFARPRHRCRVCALLSLLDIRVAGYRLVEVALLASGIEHFPLGERLVEPVGGETVIPYLVGVLHVDLQMRLQPNVPCVVVTVSKEERELVFKRRFGVLVYALGVVAVRVTAADRR